MKWCYKSVNYFKFFDDIKLIEVDELHNRIAIVFNGKESLINIFDLTPYVKYSPFIEEYVIDSDSEDNNNQTKKESDDSIENEDKSLLNEHDIDKMFQKVKLSNDDNSHNTNDKHFYNKPIIIDSTQQHCIILGDFISPKTNNTHNNKHSFPLHTLNTFNYSQETIQTIKHPQYKITSFNFTYKASIQRKQILLSIHKPKIQTKILSVISLQAHAVQKIKWFTFPSIPQIHPSKYLLTTTEEGSISIFQLKKITPSNETKVNLEDLQLQPFSNYPEEWHLLSSNIHQIPIRDFYIIEVTEPEQKYMKLLTLHIDNNISFWLLSKEQNNIKISPYYSINFDHSFLIENILIDKYENFLYCFNSKGIEIYKIKSTPPFPKIYWTLYERNFNNDAHKSKYNKISFYTKDTEDDTSSIDEELIDLNQKAFIDDVKFFKTVQEPMFISMETKILIQVYNVYTNIFDLLVFECGGLWKVLQDINFFSICIQGKDTLLIKKLYENKNNFSYCVSPFLYLKVDKEICSNNYKEVLDMKIDLFKSLENVYQLFLIKNGNDYLFGSLPLKNKTSDVKEKKMSYDNSNNRTYRKLYDNEDDIWKWKFVLKNEDENYKNVITWCKNNTILISSNKKLMYLVKFWKELNIFGLPISVNKLKEFLQ